MGSLNVYMVVIESSNSEGKYTKEYVGPATSERNAIKQARAVFKGRADDRLITVELLDSEDWVEDVAVMPPDGEGLIPP